jgi:hypothetical protein
MKYLQPENHLMDMNILYAFTKRKMEDVYFNLCISAFLEADKTVSALIIAYEVKQVHLKDQLIEAIANAEHKQKLLRRTKKPNNNFV